MASQNCVDISAGHAPVLSLILCSRNDRYMGNPVWRLQTALNYAAARVKELGREGAVEILVTDWGSDTPLHTAVQLTPEAAAMTRFVVVPKLLVQRVQKDSPFSEVHALNAAVRQAKGQYIGRIDQDTLVGRTFLQRFLEIAEGQRTIEVSPRRAIFFANRRSIPFRFAVKCPPLGQIERFVRWFGSSLKVWDYNGNYPDLYWTSFVGISLYHRDLWMECGGYDERLIYYDWMETDMIVRLRSRYPIINLGQLVDYDFYHLDHYLLRASWSALAHPRETGKAKANPKVDLENPPVAMCPNASDWGLQDHHLEVVSPISSPDIVQLRATRAGFLSLLSRAIPQTCWDRLSVGILRLIVPPYQLWSRRAHSAAQVIHGQPLLKWPQLLRTLWSEGHARRLQQEEHKS